MVWVGRDLRRLSSPTSLPMSVVLPCTCEEPTGFRGSVKGKVRCLSRKNPIIIIPEPAGALPLSVPWEPSQLLCPPGGGQGRGTSCCLPPSGRGPVLSALTVFLLTPMCKLPGLYSHTAKLRSVITEDGGNKELPTGSRLISLSASFIGSRFGAPHVAVKISGIWGHPYVHVGHTGSELWFCPLACLMWICWWWLPSDRNSSPEVPM